MTGSYPIVRKFIEKYRSKPDSDTSPPAVGAAGDRMDLPGRKAPAGSSDELTCADGLLPAGTVIGVTVGPWDCYDRDKLQASWSYPVGRTIVETSLRAAGVHLLSLDFTMHSGTATDPVLLRATRYRDIGNTYYLSRGTPDRSRCVLAVYAVPSGTRAEARAVLTTGGGLDRACAWLAAAESAEPTWHDKSHNWTAYLLNGALREAETTD
ncbi:hypothetical protein [Krasilnikovia sp. MM14-A1259]|uniref:hypothetical protein n=1 Tax=Krasilnikovia sp. MM14-A1259 TaxID=3373539 RepID=UPI0038080447